MSQNLQTKSPIVRAVAAVLPNAAWDAIKFTAPIVSIALGGAGLTTSVVARVLLSIPIGLTLALTFIFSFLVLLAGMVIYQRRQRETKETPIVLPEAEANTTPRKSTQEGVTIQVNPVISPQIVQNQTISRAAELQSQPKTIEPLSIKPIEVGIRKMWIDTNRRSRRPT